jgi:predicted dehydrogenase
VPIRSAEEQLVDKIRVGVIGVGALGQHHARIYSTLPEATLVGVVDTHLERAEAMAGSFNTQPHSDYRQLFGKVDAVSIATPTTLHAEIGEQFLKQGVSVLVEKPISHNLDDADRLIRAAEAGRSILQVGHLERFNPAIQAVREIVDRPRFFEAHRMGVFSPRSLDIDVILDLMIHDLDIISLLVPTPVVHIEAVGIAILTKRIDIANTRLQFADGCVANVTASRVSMEKIRKLRFFQAREYISIDYTRQDVAVFRLDRPPAGASQIVSQKLTPPHREPLDAELRSFLDAVQGRSPVACTGAEGRKTLELALQVLEKAEKAQAQALNQETTVSP